MNKLLLITLLFGACFLSVHAGVNPDEAETEDVVPDDEELEPSAGGSGGAGANAGVGVGLNANVDVGATLEGAESAGAQLAGGLGQVVTGLGGGLTGTGKFLKNEVTNFVQAIIDFLKKVVEAIISMVLRVLNAITEQIDKAEKELFSQVGIQRIGGYKQVVKDLGSQLQKVGGGILGGLGALGNGLREGVSGLVGADGGAQVGVGVGAGGHGHGHGHEHGPPTSELE